MTVWLVIGAAAGRGADCGCVAVATAAASLTSGAACGSIGLAFADPVRRGGALPTEFVAGARVTGRGATAGADAALSCVAGTVGAAAVGTSDAAGFDATDARTSDFDARTARGSLSESCSALERGPDVVEFARVELDPRRDASEFDASRDAVEPDVEPDR